MSLSTLLPKIGTSAVALCIAAIALSGIGVTASADGDDGGTPPTTTTTPPPATTNGHPWHN
jgi:hypothetical protein